MFFVCPLLRCFCLRVLTFTKAAAVAEGRGEGEIGEVYGRPLSDFEEPPPVLLECMGWEESPVGGYTGCAAPCQPRLHAIKGACRSIVNVILIVVVACMFCVLQYRRAVLNANSVFLCICRRVWSYAKKKTRCFIIIIIVALCWCFFIACAS